MEGREKRDGSETEKMRKGEGREARGKRASTSFL